MIISYALKFFFHMSFLKRWAVGFTVVLSVWSILFLSDNSPFGKGILPGAFLILCWLASVIGAHIFLRGGLHNNHIDDIILVHSVGFFISAFILTGKYDYVFYSYGLELIWFTLLSSFTNGLFFALDPQVRLFRDGRKNGESVSLIQILIRR